jgi:hypothetical protein
MNESHVWERLRSIMGDRWDATRHEDISGLGVPDVSFGVRGPDGPVNGWIELKYLPSWPKRSTTKVTVRHWTHEQRIFLSHRWHHGGRTWVLLAVGPPHHHEWLLFRGVDYGLLKGTLTAEELKKRAWMYWPTPPTAVEIIAGITAKEYTC